MIIKGLKSENERLASDLKRYKKSDRERDEAFEDRVTEIKRAHSREIAELNHDHQEEIRDVKSDCDELVREAEDGARDDVRSAQDDADQRVRIAEGKVQATEIAVKKAVLDEREANSGATTKLEIKVAVAEGKALAEAARADAAESLVESIEQTLENAGDNHTEFTKLILSKIATVNLDKMSINVEMPSPEVTVINGGQKGGEQKKN